MYEESESHPIIWKEFIDIPNLITTIVSIILYVVADLVPVNPLYFPPADSLSSFPFPTKEQISSIVCAVIVFGIGIILIIAFFFIQMKFPNYFRYFNPFTACYVFITVITATNVCVNIFKGYVGRPRPDLFARCGADASFDNCPSLTAKKLKDQFKSFPSGHSATAMSGFLFMALFMQKVVKTRQLWVTLLCSAFLLFAFFIGMTRIRDYKHHTDDVIAGFFVALIYVYLFWWRCYKSIFPKNKKSKRVSNDTQP